jgi:hypothetical protein
MSVHHEKACLGFKQKKEEEKTAHSKRQKNHRKEFFFLHNFNVFVFSSTRTSKSSTFETFSAEIFQPFLRCFDINHQLGVKN